MRKYFGLLLLFCTFFFASISYSQSLIGNQSNYAGSNSISMNPALLSTSYLYSDFSVIGIGLSVFNDYAYMKGGDFSKLIFDREHPLPSYHVGIINLPFLLYEKANKRFDKNIYESLDVNVLRFMYNLDDKQTLAFSLNGRVYTNGTDIPWELPEILTFGLDGNDQYYQRYSSSATEISTLEWMEVAMSYSRKIYERYLHRIDAGVSLKYLLGYSATVGNINKLDYEIFSEDSVMVNTFDADLAYSLPINYNEPFTSASLFDKSMVRGNGFAIDLGFTYSHKKDNVVYRKRLMSSCMQPKLDYLWKIGLSLMDLGFVNFKDNAMEHSFDHYGSMDFEKDNYNDISSFDELLKTMSATYFDGDPEASVIANSFKMGLPTTLRIQFDYNLRKNFYVNATFIQPIKLFEYSVKASSQILVEPRYESDYLEFALPLTLRNYKHFLVGASARIGFLTIGTQNISSYLGLGKANGMDLYVSLKFNFIKGRCDEDKFDACWSADFGNKKNKRK